MSESGLSARHDRGDGRDLRSLTFGGELLASRVYVALRDRWWRTVPLVTTTRRWRELPDGFELEVEAVSGWASHPFELTLRYRAQGRDLECTFEGTARGSFEYCRIGFCVLFPAAAWAGRPAESRLGADATAFTFPSEIQTRDHVDDASMRFHRPFDGLTMTRPSGMRLEWAFSGEPFEFEDQRNWSDATYKVYSAGDWPRRADDGARFGQSIRVHIEPALTPPPAPAPAVVTVGTPTRPLPSVALFDGRIPGSYRPPGGFQELNARRGADEAVALELGVNGAVHASDDDSVMETATMHGPIVTQAIGLAPDLPVRLAPVTFLEVAGDWRDSTGRYVPEPPAPARSARLEGDFGATWVVASVAHAAAAGVAELRYFDAALPAGPARSAVEYFGALEGRMMRETDAPPPIAALAVETDEGAVLAIANTGPDAIDVSVADGRVLTLDGFAHTWVALDDRPGRGRHSARTSSDTAAS